MKTVIDLNGNEAEVPDDTTVDTVDGVHYLLSEARQAEEEAKAAAWEAGADDRLILARILALEATQTPRRMREAAADPTWLNNLDSQIVDLRVQLT